MREGSCNTWCRKPPPSTIVLTTHSLRLSFGGVLAGDLVVTSWVGEELPQAKTIGHIDQTMGDPGNPGNPFVPPMEGMPEKKARNDK